MRLRAEHQGNLYVVYVYADGCMEIVRKADGASLFVQSSDDLSTLRSELNQAEFRRDWERAIDDVCSEYAHVMTVYEINNPME
jgi:hypothetical protein